MADEEALGFEIDLDAKLDGAKSSVDVLERLDQTLKRLDARLEESGKTTEHVGEQHEKHAKHAHTLKHELEELNKKLKDLTAFQVFEFGFDKAIELAHELLEAVIEIGSEAIKTAAAEQRTASSFKLQLGDEEGERVLKYLDEVAHATEFSRGEMKGFSQELLKAGFKAEQLPAALAATADLAAFSKDRIEGATGALSALERIQRTGKVMERSLAPLGIGEDKLIEVLQRRGAKGDAESIKKSLQAGKIDRNEVLQSVYQTITEKTGKALGGAGVEVGKGLEARLNRIKNLPEEYFEKWSQSPGFETFSDKIDLLFHKLDPDSPDGKRIFESLERALGSVTDLVDKLLTPEGIDAFVGGLKTALDTVGGLIRGLKEMIDLLNGETLSKYFYGGKNANDKQVDQIEKAASEKLGQGDIGAQALRSTFYSLGESERQDLIAAGARKGHDYTPYLPKTENKNANYGKSADFTAGDLTLDVPGAADKAFAAGQVTAEAHLDGVRQGLDAHSPSRKMAELGRFASIGFAEGIESGASMVQRSFDSSLLPAPSSLASFGGGGAGGGGIHIGEINVPIEYHGSGSADDAYALAERVREILPSALASALEQLNIELGAGAPESG